MCQDLWWRHNPTCLFSCFILLHLLISEQWAHPWDPAPHPMRIQFPWYDKWDPHLIFTSRNWVTSSPAPHQTRACILHEIYQVFYREVPVCLEAAPDLQVYDVDAKAELVPESAPADPKPSCTNYNYSFFSNKFHLHHGATNTMRVVCIYIYIHVYILYKNIFIISYMMI